MVRNGVFRTKKYEAKLDPIAIMLHYKHLRDIMATNYKFWTLIQEKIDDALQRLYIENNIGFPYRRIFRKFLNQTKALGDKYSDATYTLELYILQRSLYEAIILNETDYKMDYLNTLTDSELLAIIDSLNLFPIPFLDFKEKYLIYPNIIYYYFAGQITSYDAQTSSLFMHYLRHNAQTDYNPLYFLRHNPQVQVV